MSRGSAGIVASSLRVRTGRIDDIAYAGCLVNDGVDTQSLQAYPLYPAHDAYTRCQRRRFKDSLRDLRRPSLRHCLPASDPDGATALPSDLPWRRELASVLGDVLRIRYRTQFALAFLRASEMSKLGSAKYAARTGSGLPLLVGNTRAEFGRLF